MRIQEDPAKGIYTNGPFWLWAAVYIAMLLWFILFVWIYNESETDFKTLLRRESQSIPYTSPR